MTKGPTYYMTKGPTTTREDYYFIEKHTIKHNQNGLTIKLLIKSIVTVINNEQTK